MTIYARVESGQIQEYPLTENQIKQRFTNVSWVNGEFSPPDGYAEVTEVPQPLHDGITENCVEGPPLFDINGWTQTWIIETASSEIIAARTNGLAASLRKTRNARLTASDWTQLPDVNMANKTDWATYRQALRDITEQPGFPTNVTWPTEPGV